MNDYLNWHYKIYLPRLLTIFSNLFIFPIYYFSIPLHLKTLFSPWKRQIIAKKRGFRLNDVFAVISFNITSSVIGIVVRSAFIFYGLFLSILLPLLFLPVLLIWPLIPGLTYFIYTSRQKSADVELAEYKISKSVNNRLTAFLKARLPDFPGSKDTDVDKCLNWYKMLTALNEGSLLLSKKRIKAITGIGTDWAYGYTVNLDKYSRDMTKTPSPYPFLLGRDRELAEIERGLLKSENNNVLIIGEPGTGRHILIETLAHNLLLGKCDPNLAHKRILHLDMHALFADAQNHDQLKSLFSDLLYEAQAAGNINIYIDDIDKYMSSAEGRVDLVDVLSKFATSRIGVIATTTPSNYHSFIETNETFNKIFVEINLRQPSEDEVLRELEVSIVPVLERKYPIVITLPALEKVIQDSSRFLTSTPFPGKAVELLEETVIWKIAQKNGNTVTASDIDAYLSQKLHLPLGDIQKQESEILVNLENFLHQRVVNQNLAIRLIASALRRSRLDISSAQKPIGSFLFLGPTGVGKTETAKALAQAYFKNEDELIRFDMSQYQGEEGLIRLIGSKASGITGELTTQIKEKPYSVLLFDEIEKASQMILNLFLTLLDEGYISDGLGRKADCRNTIIIATSNAGAEFIRESLLTGTSEQQLSKNIIDYILKSRIFSPEFINRFTATVVYTPLTEGQLKEVAKIMLHNLNSRLKKKELSINITPELINYLASLGSNKEFGARSIKREIETNIEDQIAQKLLIGNVRKDQPIQIDLKSDT